MPQLDYNSAIEKLRALPEDRQRAILAKMAPEDKKQIMAHLSGTPKTPTVPVPMSATVPESTFGSRAREAAIGVLEPFTLENVAGAVKQGGSVLSDILTGHGWRGIKTANDIATSMIETPIEKVKGYVTAVKSGDYDAAAYNAGGILSQTAPAVAGAVEAGADIAGVKVPSTELNLAGKFKEKARSALQGKTGSSAFSTTEPAVKGFNEESAKATDQQAKSDDIVAQKNREAEAAAQGKTAAQNQSITESNEAARLKAESKTAENQQKVKAQLEANRQAAATNARKESVTRSIKEGSQRLGESVKDLDAKLRAEGNGKYSAVREAVKDDPGTPLSDLAQAARHAEANILKGSAENIKQFRELARKAPEDEGIVSGEVTFPPDSNLYKMLQNKGAIAEGGNIPFDQLQGYSSEIGTKLAKGGLPGDIYQALKYLKERIDAAKTTIADRNGVGAALRNADSFWHNYMDAFYDSDSAVAKVREGVGTVDPEFYADAFTKGKAGDVAISKLKTLKTAHAADAGRVADLARNLRSAQTELEGTRTAKVSPVEKPERVTAETKPTPSPVQPEVTPRKVVDQPSVPTAEGIIEDKANKVKATAYGLGKLSKYDVVTLGSSAIAAALGDFGKAIGIPAIRFGVPALLKNEALIKWISQPTEADVAAAMKLDGPARAELVSNLRKVIDANKANGKSIPVAPSVQRLISNTGNVTNRRDALDKLGHPAP